ncbi:MAG: sensor histidine kinase [Magnetococcales bacterium]|nr:sensor histidine kinase [Magnetococcales bacterium]
MRSVARQLQAGMTALLLTIFLILFAINDHLAKRQADAVSWREIGHKAEWLLASLADDRETHCREPPGSGLYCQWGWRKEGRWEWHLSPSLAGRPIALPELPAGGRGEWNLPEPDGGEMMVVALSIRFAQGELALAVGQSRALQKGQLRKWRSYHLLFSLAVAALAVALACWLVTLTFALFDQQNRLVTRWQAGEAPHPPAGIEETRPLVMAIERQMEAGKRHMQRVRRTLSHIGHTMRMPMTVLLHLAESPDLRGMPEVKAILAEQTGLLERMLERHLRRASLSGPDTHDEWFRPGEDLPAMVRTLDRLHYDKGLDIVVQIPEALRCPGNRDDFLELIGNLADNACKWARSRVILSAGNEGGFWLTIEDDGPGVEETQLAILRQWTGKRLDENQEGHGMGLIIAREIVALYDGEITLGRSPALGGFMVSIRLF